MSNGVCHGNMQEEFIFLQILSTLLSDLISIQWRVNAPFLFFLILKQF